MSSEKKVQKNIEGGPGPGTYDSNYIVTDWEFRFTYHGRMILIKLQEVPL